MFEIALLFDVRWTLFFSLNFNWIWTVRKSNRDCFGRTDTVLPYQLNRVLIDFRNLIYWISTDVRLIFVPIESLIIPNTIWIGIYWWINWLTFLKLIDFSHQQQFCVLIKRFGFCHTAWTFEFIENSTGGGYLIIRAPVKRFLVFGQDWQSSIAL